VGVLKDVPDNKMLFTAEGATPAPLLVTTQPMKRIPFHLRVSSPHEKREICRIKGQSVSGAQNKHFLGPH
jgi:hypothetical protein